MFYEIKNQGKPVILIHGNNEDCRIFKKYPIYFPNNQLIFIDSYNHGLSIKRKTTLVEISQNIITLISFLKLDNPIIIGFSDGANIGLLINLSLQFKSVLIGGNLFYKGLNFLTRIGIKLSRFLCLNKVKKQNINLMLNEPNLSFCDLNKIGSEILLIYGARDCIQKNHYMEILNNLKYATLKIVKGNHFLINNQEVIKTIKEFIK